MIAEIFLYEIIRDLKNVINIPLICLYKIS